MKRILLPTDGSENAEHALNYAIQLFEGEQVEFILFRSIEIQAYSADLPIPMMPDLTDAVRGSLNATAARLQDKYAETKFKFIAQVGSGSLSFNVEQLVADEAIDLVVMGTMGASGITASIIGSNTTDVISTAKCPVLAVPASADLSIPKEILFATDNKGLADKHVLQPLIFLAGRFGSHIHMMNVLDEGDFTSVDAAVEGLILDHMLEKVHHTYYFVNANDRVEAIENHLNTHNIDLLVVIPRHNDFFSSIFHRSVTRKLALQSKVPLLALSNSVA